MKYYLLGECRVHDVDRHSIRQRHDRHELHATLSHHPVQDAIVGRVYRVLEYRHHCVGKIVH